ncbi:CMP-N-acetylneuraminic acid synthetase [Desulfobaculum xiamenense]|uniref:CMP-N-acetylneuraminic acid synthetase n=1 Tax=Desulfobaculum xiamenense TaxID=995050 RepID=A0A846QNB9_9BACT|nr:acylneuraminate cytidylyltransferase family protein [Desulfobaculum xiamenense]NJB67952.1 CMP-N-acetylneuraminic acid synthetase [Desulfobaculum xiamenense]
MHAHPLRKDMRAVAIIPARGGSKGLPHKNVRLLGGRPLIAWTIAAALRSRRISRVIVSTDDPDIAAVAREWGAETPFLRPAELSGDTARLGAVTRHALAELARQGEHPDVAATLYPTHPFRPKGLVDRLVERNMAGYAVVVPVRRINCGPCAHVAAGRFLPAAEQPVYRQYGLYDGTCVSFEGRGVWYEILDDPVHCTDIDTADDLRLAEAILDAGLFAWPGDEP